MFGGKNSDKHNEYDTLDSSQSTTNSITPIPSNVNFFFFVLFLLFIEIYLKISGSKFFGMV